MSKSSIIAIIVTYNGSRWIRKCLSSLKNNNVALKVLAIDNCSEDNTCDVIRDEFPEIELIINKRNLGFGAANNIGLRRALKENADYVFLLNQDAWVETDTIEKLVEASFLNPEFGILSPMQHFDQNNLDHNFSLYIEAAQKDFPPVGDIQPAKFVNAAMWLIPVSKVKVLGGFSPLYYHYGEDVDYSNRAISHSVKSGILLTVKGFHERIQQPTFTGSYLNFLRKKFNYKSLVILGNINFSPLACVNILSCEIWRIKSGSTLKSIILRLVVLVITIIKTVVVLPKLIIHRRQSSKSCPFL